MHKTLNYKINQFDKLHCINTNKYTRKKAPAIQHPRQPLYNGKTSGWYAYKSVINDFF